eukprot:1105670-Pyramimonas_sp.AAC.1
MWNNVEDGIGIQRSWKECKNNEHDKRANWGELRRITSRNALESHERSRGSAETAESSGEKTRRG